MAPRRACRAPLRLATGDSGGTAAVAEEERQTAPRPAAGDSGSRGGAADGRQLQSDPPAAARGGCAAGPITAYALVLWKMAHLALPAAVPDDDPRVLALLAAG